MQNVYVLDSMGREFGRFGVENFFNFNYNRFKLRQEGFNLLLFMSKYLSCAVIWANRFISI